MAQLQTNYLQEHTCDIINTILERITGQKVTSMFSKCDFGFDLLHLRFGESDSKTPHFVKIELDDIGSDAHNLDDKFISAVVNEIKEKHSMLIL